MRTTFLLLVLTVASFIHSQVIKTINVETAGTLSVDSIFYFGIKDTLIIKQYNLLH